ncbi:MAG: glycosyltransferase family 8 protein [Gammaproteobacteria bacterium]|nr:glycosyltransferase family 8 protein [Gammaproteobacteria bacterium]
MKFDKSMVYIACAADLHFATPLLVMVNSLLANYDQSRAISIYLLTNTPKYFSKSRMLKSLQGDRVEITVIDVDDRQFARMKVSKGRITRAAYYRLLLPDLLPHELEKVIYLDSDLIVNTDIGKLWDLDIEDNHILAVQEQGHSAQLLSSADGLLMYKELNIDPYAKQFNSGVMLINLDKWRKDNIFQKVIECLKEHQKLVRWWDQDGLNAVLADSWGEIDHRWNLLSQIFSNPSWQDSPIKDEETYQQLIRHPYIIHFNTSSKPWHKENKHPFKYLYLGYLNRLLISSQKNNEKYYAQTIFRPIQLLNKKIENYNYKFYYENFREKILHTGPVECNVDSEFEVHIVTSKNDFLDAIWCLKTFYHYSDTNPQLVIHEDGSLNAKQIETFSAHFINCRIIKKKDADRKLKAFLADYKYSQKYRLDEDFFCALKLFDPFYYAKTNKLLLLDSDILFFDNPVEIITNLKECNPFFNSDYQNAYALPIEEINSNFSIDMLPMVNAGLMSLSKDCYIANLDFIESYFEKMDSLQPIGDINRHEQTLNALLLSKCGGIRLNENYQISRHPIIPGKTVSHHFVGDGSRANFYRKGLKVLKRNKLLKIFDKSQSNRKKQKKC